MGRSEESLVDVHRALLERWRGAMNLVGPGDLEQHYEDAAAALGVFAEHPPLGRWADLGTGAGFPGILFAARHAQVALDLVDSRQKRCAFLQHVLREAEVDPVRVRVLCARIESLPAEGYDGVMARALAPPEAVLVHARRLLRPQGWVLLLMGEDAPPRAADFAPLAAVSYTIAGSRRWARLLSRSA